MSLGAGRVLKPHQRVFIKHEGGGTIPAMASKTIPQKGELSA